MQHSSMHAVQHTRLQHTSSPRGAQDTLQRSLHVCMRCALTAYVLPSQAKPSQAKPSQAKPRAVRTQWLSLIHSGAAPKTVAAVVPVGIEGLSGQGVKAFKRLKGCRAHLELEDSGDCRVDRHKRHDVHQAVLPCQPVAIVASYTLWRTRRAKAQRQRRMRTNAMQQKRRT